MNRDMSPTVSPGIHPSPTTCGKGRGESAGGGFGCALNSTGPRACSGAPLPPWPAAPPASSSAGPHWFQTPRLLYLWLFPLLQCFSLMSASSPWIYSILLQRVDVTATRASAAFTVAAAFQQRPGLQGPAGLFSAGRGGFAPWPGIGVEGGKLLSPPSAWRQLAQL